MKKIFLLFSLVFLCGCSFKSNIEVISALQEKYKTTKIYNPMCDYLVFLEHEVLCVNTYDFKVTKNATPDDIKSYVLTTY